MSKMSNKEAVEYAEKLKEYCKKRHCTRCPFKVKVNRYNDTCLLNYPTSWEEGRVIQKAIDRIAERDEMLYKAGY